MAATSQTVWAMLEGGGVLCYTLDSADEIVAQLVHRVYLHHRVQYSAYGRVTYGGAEIRADRKLSDLTTTMETPICVSTPPPPPLLGSKYGVAISLVMGDQ